MIDPIPRRLPVAWPVEGRTGTALPGWKGILLGLPFVALGLVVALFVAPRRSGHDAPREVIEAFGALFVAAGAIFVITSVRPILRERRRAKLLETHRAEPWWADFPWDRRGIAGDAGRQVRAAFWAIGGIGAFISMLGYFAFGYLDVARMGRGVWLMRGCVVFFAVVLAASTVKPLRLLLRWLAHGNGFLNFGRFPFLLGETADVRVAPLRAARDLRRLGVTLRCVEERIEREKGPGTTHISLARWQLWADSRSFEPAELAGGGLELSFKLPSDARLGSDLSATVPRYWELAVTAERKGVGFASTFLVPVYAVPGSTEATARTG